MSDSKNLDTAFESLKLAREKSGTNLPLYFRFHWNGGRHKAEIAETNGQLVLALSMDCGKLPFTAEAPQVRARMMKLAQDTTPRRYSPKGLVDQKGWFVVTPKKRLRFREVTSFQGKLNTHDIMSAVATRLIANRHMPDFARDLWN